MTEIIELGDNKYSVDIDNTDDIKRVLITEIMFQHNKHNIVARRYGQSEQVDYTPQISITRRTGNKGSLQITYWPTYSVYNSYRSIICFTQDIRTSMKNLITKVIKKCEQTNESHAKTQEKKEQFIQFVNSEFGHMNDMTPDFNRYHNSAYAEFKTDDVKASLSERGVDGRYHLYVTVDEDRESIIRIINKLFS